jgi:hypothetical protein
MGSASREFLLMRANEESGQLYVPAMPKKDIKAKAEEDAKTIINEGDFYADEVLIDATRISEYLTTFIRTLRDNMDEEQTRDAIKGVEISFKNAPSRLNYSDDTTWQEIKEKLSEREELLKLAEKSKDAIYDADGAEVPRVSRSGGGRSINLKY